MHNKLLNKYYFINKFNQSHIDKQHKETAIIYRNYDQKIDEKLIKKIKNYCKKRGNKFLLSNNMSAPMFELQLKNRELQKHLFDFIGAGTMLLAFTGTVGWKHYYSKSTLSVSSVVCGQYIAHLGFSGFMSTMSTSLEYNLAKWAKVKLGGLGLIIFADGDIDLGALPFAGLNFTF